MRPLALLPRILLAVAIFAAGCRPGGSVDDVPHEAPRDGVPPSDVAVTQESEPNDAPETADDLPAEGWLAGSLPAGDTDWIRWASASQPGMLEIEVDGPVKLAILDVDQRFSRTYTLEPSEDAQRLGPFSRDGLQWVRLTGTAEHWRIRALDAESPPACVDAAATLVAERWPVAWRSCLGAGEEVVLRVPFAHFAELAAMSLELALELGERVEIAVEDEGETALGPWSVDASGWRLHGMRRPEVPGALALRIRAPAEGATFRLLMDEAPESVEGRLVVLEPNDTLAQAFRVFSLRDLVGWFHTPDDVDALRIAPHVAGFGRYALEIEPEGATVLVEAFDVEESVTGSVRAEGGAVTALGCPRTLSVEEPLRIRLSLESPQEGVSYRLVWQPLAIESPLPTVPAWPWPEDADGGEDVAPLEAPEPAEDEAPAEVVVEDPWLLRDADEASGGLYLGVGQQIMLAFDVRGPAPESRDGHDGGDDGGPGDAPLPVEEGTLNLRATPADAVRIRMRLVDDEGAVVSVRTATEEGGSLVWSVELPTGRYGVELDLLEGARAACGSSVSFSAQWTPRPVEPTEVERAPGAYPERRLDRAPAPAPDDDGF